MPETTLDSMVEQASVPNLAAMLRRGREMGVIDTVTTNYPHEASA